MLSGFPVSVTQSTYNFSTLMSLNRDNANVDLKELAKGNKVYVRSLMDTLGTFSQGFEKTNNITEAYIDYVSKMPKESVNVIQYEYEFNIVNNIYTDFTVSDDLSSHFKEGDSWEYNGGTMSVSAIRSMYATVLTHVKGYDEWGKMISSVRTFAEIPNNFDYVMSQYDVIVADVDGKPVKTGYTQDYVEELFNSKETLIMVLDEYQFNDLMLGQYGYFNEDEFLDYAFAGVGKADDVELVGKDGLPYSDFVGDDAKKFTYYPNDSVYSFHEYTQSELSDEEVRAYMIAMGERYGMPEEQAGMFAYLIIQARNESNEELKKLLEQYNMGMLYTMFRKAEKTEGFIANAYTTEYSIDDEAGAIVLPAFKDTESYDKSVEMGVKLILQKKPSVSYGCLDTGIYYTNALTNYVLDLEKDSKIVNYILEHGELEDVPCYVDYYYVNDTEGENNYVFDTVKGSVDKGGDMMSSIMGSIMGTSTKITAGLLGGSRLPKAVYIYSVDFELKDVITAYLDEWNEMCEREESYTYVDFDGKTQTVKLSVQDKITYTDTVGMIIAMVNTMIKMITIALIAFTALSLVVSTVMIGIITYVSVVERVKEIGILRAVGARKKDIKRLFNAETFIIGSFAGLFGILITYILSLIINVIVLSLAGIWGIAALPWWQAVIMVCVSVVLTLFSGLIPAAAAAKKDPVVALRTE